ncbi:hypothetical protein GH810_11175 [Acetobacterium paludosum]|uniref:Asparagine synthetase domain-containing protein n=1 Tax=Acetobacterium paludosum TaxID=52693 RepID=A0A923KWX0_9FIRM|nr:asparagine synthase-related protein [Acetobacterium paludosum]MBC3888875.1 hypothetical protein [Acetobacterium paludosum]
MASIKKHRKQWFIANNGNLNMDQLQDFLSIKLSDHAVLYYDSDLRLTYFDWPDGRKTLVLGLLLGTPESSETMYYHCGRFVAITSGWLSLDATGSMGVFYSEDSSREPSGIICGSSCALIGEVFHLPLSGRDLRSAHMKFDPAPLSRLPNMKRLFIDQKFNLKDGSVVVHPRSVSSQINFEEASLLLEKELTNIALELKKTKRPIYLALTGGSDSRAVFSALIKAQTDFEAFTFLLDEPRSRIDARVAKSLCSKFGIQHKSILSEGSNAADLEVYFEHTGRCGGDRADRYVSGNYYRYLPDNAIVLHGGAFEIGQRSFRETFKYVEFSNVEKAPIDIEKSYFDNFDEKELNAYKEWLIYRQKNPIAGVDMLDSFFLDQRRAAWGAANRQAEDCYGFDWLVFANSWSIIDTLLRVSVEDRCNNMVEERTMERLVPGILTIEPINPGIDFITKSKKLFYSVMRRLNRIISRGR